MLYNELTGKLVKCVCGTIEVTKIQHSQIITLEMYRVVAVLPLLSINKEYLEKGMRSVYLGIYVGKIIHLRGFQYFDYTALFVLV